MFLLVKEISYMEMETLSLLEMAKVTRTAARELAVLTTTVKNQALAAIAANLEQNTEAIIAANEADCQGAITEGISPSLLARLKLGESKLKAAIAGVRDVIKLPDPIGTIQIKRELDSNLILKRVTCPLGVLGVIFEARPEALIQIASLAIKSGNGVILKGGKEATRSCQILVKVIQEALTNLSQNEPKLKFLPETIQLLTTRAEIKSLLQLDEFVDLIIPRGSNAFVRYIQDHTRIPVLGHADGICHLYVDRDADLNKAIAITVDSKTQYPAACNAIETLLVDQLIAPEFLAKVANALQQKGVKLKGDAATQMLIDVDATTEEDWRTEYSDLILAIKLVPGVTEAIEHINTYGSKHTDGIVTENPQTAQEFLDKVDAAGVYHNCSTRFADGFRYGFGAEVGISTQKMPPRGPVGLEGLVTYKYYLSGDGHIVESYTGENGKSFTHQDLPLINDLKQPEQ